MIFLSPSMCFRSSVCYQNQKLIDQSRGASKVKVYVKWNDYQASVDKNSTTVQEFLGAGEGGGGERVKLQSITTITTFIKNRHFFLLQEGLGKPKFQLKLTRDS